MASPLAHMRKHSSNNAVTMFVESTVDVPAGLCRLAASSMTVPWYPGFGGVGFPSLGVCCLESSLRHCGCQKLFYIFVKASHCKTRNLSDMDRKGTVSHDIQSFYIERLLLYTSSELCWICRPLRSTVIFLMPDALLGDSVCALPGLAACPDGCRRTGVQNSNK